MSFTALIHEGHIDLNPPYQRGERDLIKSCFISPNVSIDVVWPESKQIGLIDSIFRNFYIPPVVFAVTKEDGEDVRVCVDGKQRLTSIQKFFDGQASQTSSLSSFLLDSLCFPSVHARYLVGLSYEAQRVFLTSLAD